MASFLRVAADLNIDGLSNIRVAIQEPNQSNEKLKSNTGAKKEKTLPTKDNDIAFDEFEPTAKKKEPCQNKSEDSATEDYNIAVQDNVDETELLLDIDEDESINMPLKTK